MIVTTKQSHFGVEVQSFVSAITQPKIISGPDYYNKACIFKPGLVGISIGIRSLPFTRNTSSRCVGG